MSTAPAMPPSGAYTAAATAATDSTADADQIRALLATYAQALNTADAEAAAAVYAPDGVFYPYNLPTASGAQLRGAYEQIFEAIQLTIAFTLHEVVVDGDVAFATTSSKGQVLVRATGGTGPEENRELFAFTRRDGRWGIAHYMFNKATAVAGAGT